MVADENKYWFEQNDPENNGKSPEADGTESSRPAASELGAAEGRTAQSDPHEAHYRSDFERCSVIPESDLNKNGRIKAVRKQMLNKLLKYDYRALFKYLLPCYIAMFALSLVSGASFLILRYSSSTMAGRIFSSVMGLYVLSVFVCVVICGISIPVRYYKNLFSGEGYLTLSIPATPEEHIFSKLISGFTTALLTVALTVISVVLVLLTGNILTFANIGKFFADIGRWIASSPADSIFGIIEIILLVPLCEFIGLQIFQCCICIGQIFTKKNRIAMAFAVYVAFSAIMRILSVFLFGAFNDFAELLASLNGHVVAWFFILLLAGANVGAFFLQRYILKHKINLA